MNLIAIILSVSIFFVLVYALLADLAILFLSADPKTAFIVVGVLGVVTAVAVFILFYQLALRLP